MHDGNNAESSPGSFLYYFQPASKEPNAQFIECLFRFTWKKAVYECISITGRIIIYTWMQHIVTHASSYRIKKLEMCQYDTDAPPRAILIHTQVFCKKKKKKKAITLIRIGRFYPKSNLTIFYDYIIPGYKL